MQDEAALKAHGKFVAAMKKLDDDITARNKDARDNIRSEVGSRSLPYEFLRPHSGPGVTRRGVPYSTSI